MCVVPLHPGNALCRHFVLFTLSPDFPPFLTNVEGGLLACQAFLIMIVIDSLEQIFQFNLPCSAYKVSSRTIKFKRINFLLNTALDFGFLKPYNCNIHAHILLKYNSGGVSCYCNCGVGEDVCHFTNCVPRPLIVFSARGLAPTNKSSPKDVKTPCVPGGRTQLTRVSSSTKETLGSDKKTLKSWHDRINQVNVKFTCIVSIYKPARLIIRLLFRFASDSAKLKKIASNSETACCLDLNYSKSN